MATNDINDINERLRGLKTKLDSMGRLKVAPERQEPERIGNLFMNHLRNTMPQDIKNMGVRLVGCYSESLEPAPGNYLFWYAISVTRINLSEIYEMVNKWLTEAGLKVIHTGVNYYFEASIDEVNRVARVMEDSQAQIEKKTDDFAQKAQNIAVVGSPEKN